MIESTVLSFNIFGCLATCRNKSDRWQLIPAVFQVLNDIRMAAASNARPAASLIPEIGSAPVTAVRGACLLLHCSTSSRRCKRPMTPWPEPSVFQRVP